jgi:hypothetical protein
MKDLISIIRDDEAAAQKWREEAASHKHGPFRVYNESTIPSNAVFCNICRAFYGPEQGGKCEKG